MYVVRMGRNRLAFAVIAIAGATFLYGCASSSVAPADDAAASACEVTAAAAAGADCNADDIARQARDAADYKDEPALGYLNSPPFMLPVPVSARNTGSN